MIGKTIVFLILAVRNVSTSLESSGLSVKLNDVDYFISPFSQGRAYDQPLDAQSRGGQFGFVPVTVIAETSTNIAGLLTNWSTIDDVWQPGFLTTIILASSGRSRSGPVSMTYYANFTSEILPLQESSQIPSGPYFLDTYTGEVHQAFRLYDDFAGAFTQSLLQKPDGTFQTLSAHIQSSASLTIGVPSRLYFTATKEKPLAGVRVGVKDIFTLAGARRSNGNRAWYGLYPPASQTCTVMQNLLDAGAIIVGLQKLSQFANGEIPTADWVDYHAPFNPRGDGYQDTASSSAGAGSSIGSYEWLDLAVGSDTGGSIRGPAAVQGVFGNRPTHGLVSLDNVMPMSPSLDTVGFLARDPYIWGTAQAAMYKDNYTSYGSAGIEYPEKLYILDFPTEDTPTTKILNKFSADLAAFLNATMTPLNISKEWETSAPAQVGNNTIPQLLNLTYTALITMDQTRLLRDHFYKDYAAVHDGRLPFVDPVPLARWSWGDEQPGYQRTNAIENKTLFMDWFNEKILPRSPNTKTCSSSIILHTDSTGSLSNRNRYLNPPALPFGFSNGEISVFAEIPDSVFPLGEIPVLSTITNHTELVPVAVDVMVAKECDGLIAKLALDLVEAGIIKKPKAGSTLNGGEILLRRDDLPWTSA
ncbi:unnamed protein product [Clonostachys rosea f. rosea IK726]|uniref:Uncharacterized protein n=2 Tax=Bionectria ochroleuca TaxID=29856 RepID=A0A0B7KHI9_BIOOC|nr:unnamed protein product [Clonostachys rosea f. rosea IK726]